jgi:hypothetical protein
MVVREGGAGHDGLHRAVWWPARWRGEAGGEEEETTALELSVGRLGAWRSETRSGTRCGEVLWYERGLLYVWGGNGGEGRRLVGEVSFNLIGFNIESGRGVDAAPSRCGRVKAAGWCFGSAPSKCGMAIVGGMQCGGAAGWAAVAWAS